MIFIKIMQEALSLLITNAAKGKGNCKYSLASMLLWELTEQD